MSLLFVMNFPTNTGYAWATIERVFAGVSERLIGDGARVYACYPSLAPGAPQELAGVPVEVLEFDYQVSRRSLGGLLRFLRLLRRLRIRVLYLTDQPTWSPRYPLFFLAGVRALIIQDRTSGGRTVRGPVVGALKRVLHRIPTLAGTGFVGISRYVVERLVAVNGTPRGRTHLVYNGIDLARYAGAESGILQQLLGLTPSARIVFASGRAQAYKGIGVFIEAAAILARRKVPNVVFAYCGDGPALTEFRRQATTLGLTDFHFLGRRDDLPRLLGSATVVVVPSLWAEAFGLTVVEAMAAGVPVVATRTGGIPELIADGQTGLLVPPNDPEALADAINRLLGDAALRTRVVRQAREAARREYSIDKAIASLTALLRPEVSRWTARA